MSKYIHLMLALCLSSTAFAQTTPKYRPITNSTFQTTISVTQMVSLDGFSSTSANMGPLTSSISGYTINRLGSPAKGYNLDTIIPIDMHNIPPDPKPPKRMFGIFNRIEEVKGNRTNIKGELVDRMGRVIKPEPPMKEPPKSNFDPSIPVVTKDGALRAAKAWVDSEGQVQIQQLAEYMTANDVTSGFYSLNQEFLAETDEGPKKYSVTWVTSLDANGRAMYGNPKISDPDPTFIYVTYYPKNIADGFPEDWGAKIFPDAGKILYQLLDKNYQPKTDFKEIMTNGEYDSLTGGYYTGSEAGWEGYEGQSLNHQVECLIDNRYSPSCSGPADIRALMDAHSSAGFILDYVRQPEPNYKEISGSTGNPDEVFEYPVGSVSYTKRTLYCDRMEQEGFFNFPMHIHSQRFIGEPHPELVTYQEVSAEYQSAKLPGVFDDVSFLNPQTGEYDSKFDNIGNRFDAFDGKDNKLTTPFKVVKMHKDVFNEFGGTAGYSIADVDNILISPLPTPKFSDLEGTDESIWDYRNPAIAKNIIYRSDMRADEEGSGIFYPTSVPGNMQLRLVSKNGAFREYEVGTRGSPWSGLNTSRIGFEIKNLMFWRDAQVISNRFKDWIRHDLNGSSIHNGPKGGNMLNYGNDGRRYDSCSGYNGNYTCKDYLSYELDPEDEEAKCSSGYSRSGNTCSKTNTYYNINWCQGTFCGNNCPSPLVQYLSRITHHGGNSFTGCDVRPQGAGSGSTPNILGMLNGSYEERDKDKLYNNNFNYRNISNGSGYSTMRIRTESCGMVNFAEDILDSPHPVDEKGEGTKEAVDADALKKAFEQENFWDGIEEIPFQDD